MKIVYYNNCDSYLVNADGIWMHWDYFYTTKYGVFGDEAKTTERCPPDNIMRWILSNLLFLQENALKI